MNVLIIKLGALGDVVMATPLIRAIQAHHRGAGIHLLTTEAFAPIFAHWPELNVIARPRRGWRNTWVTLRAIRALRCERIYDLQGSDRSAVLCALSGVAIRAGNHTRFPYTHHPVSAWTGQSHIFERLCEVLVAAGVSDIDRVPWLPAAPAERSAVAGWLASQELAAGTFAILHAGASAGRPEKCWSHYAGLGARLADAGICPVWIGRGADRRVNERLARDVGIDATDRFGIAELAELGRHARFAVTNDSGPMHVLAASGIPVFGLFGPSDWRRNHALGQADNVIACVDLCPDLRGRRIADCLDRIRVDDVWTRLRDARLVGS